MKKVDVSQFSDSELKDLVNNAKRVFNDEMGGDLSLNQVRDRLAHLFGAKSWQSIHNAVGKEAELSQSAVKNDEFFGDKSKIDRPSIKEVTATEEGTVYIGQHVLFGDRNRALSPPTGTGMVYHGPSVEAVCAEMAFAFGSLWFDDIFSEFEEKHDIPSLLDEMGIEGRRKDALITQIQAMGPRFYRKSHLFTYEEMMEAYNIALDGQVHVFIERIDCRKPAICNRKIPANVDMPLNVNIIHYDIDAGIAIELLEDTLLGFPAINDCPSPYEYDWHRRFTITSLSQSQTDALKRAGLTDIVNRFEAQGAVSEG